MNWYQEQKSHAMQKLLHFVDSIGGWEVARKLANTPDEQLHDDTRVADNGITRFFTKMRKKMLITLLAAACGVSYVQMTQNTDHYINQLIPPTHPTLIDPNAYDDANAEITTNNAPQYNFHQDSRSFHELPEVDLA